MSDSVRPHGQQPTRLPSPWDSPGKNIRVGCHFLLQCRKVKSESEVAQSCLTLATPWTAAYQAPPSMGFSRQEYWSGVPSPSPMKELGLVILTCSFLSSVELTEKNFKVLIVLERNMRKHKAFCSCAQKIIYKVTIAICSRIFTKNIPG